MGRKLKTDYTEETPVNIPNVNPNLVNRLNTYCNELEIERKDFILNLIEDKLDGLVLDNTEIKLPNPFYFNLKELQKNGTVKASIKNPVHEREEIQIVKTVPNNLDTFNSEYKTFCSENIPSLHLGLTMVTELNSEDHTTLEDGLKDTIYIYSYDSQENTLEITIGNDINMYFKREQEELKQAILEKNKTIHLLYKCSIYDKDGNQREEINNRYLKVMLEKIHEQRTYFTSFKNMKEFKENFIDSFSDKDGVIDNPVVKHLLDQLKEF